MNEPEGDRTKLLFVCAEAGSIYIQNGPKTVRIIDNRAGETLEIRGRGSDRVREGLGVSGVWCDVVRRAIVLLGSSVSTFWVCARVARSRCGGGCTGQPRRVHITSDSAARCVVCPEGSNPKLHTSSIHHNNALARRITHRDVFQQAYWATSPSSFPPLCPTSTPGDQRSDARNLVFSRATIVIPLTIVRFSLRSMS